jgi:aspartate-semialdehyde dehydrogenase
MAAQNKKYVVAVVGATGAVGTEMIRTIEKRRFPVSTLVPLASSRSKGKFLIYKRKKIEIRELTEKSFEGVDIALFSAGGSISKKFAPLAVKAGAVVVDNTSAFRMDPEIPLVVPEINPEDISSHRGIIANPNCSTIQMVLALFPIHRKFRIRRIVVSTYQSVSGAGQRSINALLNESMTRLSGGGKSLTQPVMGKPIAFNLIPQIDVFLPDGYTKEEMKMVNETRKIFHDDSILISPTCVRVPVIRGHSESINIETEKPFTIRDIRKALKEIPNLSVVDKPAKKEYPMPVDCEGHFETFVGRIRLDSTVQNGLNLWVVSDNLLKGAAFNAVQIAECLIGKSPR